MERPLQGGDLAAGAHENSQLAPGHLAPHVGEPQLAGDVRSLRPAVRVGADGHHVVELGSLNGGADGVPVGSDLLGVQPGRQARADDLRRDRADDRPEPARATQDHDRCAVAGSRAERLREAQQAANVRTAEPVDGLVGVTHRDERGLRHHERLQQGDLQRVGVLVLVDVDGPELPPQQARHRGLVRPDDGSQQQLAVVHDVLEDHDLLLLAGQLAHRRPGGPARPLPDPREVAALETELTRPRQHRPHLVRQPESRQRTDKLLRPVHRAVLDRTSEQLADANVLLRAGHQPRRVEVVLRRVRAPQQGVRERVERGDRRHDAAAQAGGHPVAQLRSGLAPEREGQHRVGGQRIGLVGEPGADRLDDRGRLAGARPGEHEEGAGAVRHHPELLVVEGSGRGGRRRAHVQLPLHEAWIPPASDTPEARSGTIRR